MVYNANIFNDRSSVVNLQTLPRNRHIDERGIESAMAHRIMTTITRRVVRLQYKKPGPKPLPQHVKKRRVNISLSPYWHQVGKTAATTARLSFSAYLEQLIYADSLHNESVE